ncbi:MAG: hypothetical protein O3A63_03795 [Proteobacteria bacterium]|nr:hypothetical protein [Pseudomonadota bacterium]
MKRALSILVIAALCAGTGIAATAGDPDFAGDNTSATTSDAAQTQRTETNEAWSGSCFNGDEAACSDLLYRSDLYPYHKSAYANRARIYSAAGRWEDALADLDQALAFGADERLLINRANVLLKSGQIHSAIDAYSALLAERPVYIATLYFNRAAAYRALNDQRRAFEDWSAAKAYVAESPPM